MGYVKSAKIVAKTLILFAGVTAGLLGGGVAAQGGDTDVQVMVCPRPSESNITIAQPQSDSVVDQPKVAISGSVKHISQIDFFLDDTYNHTMALGLSDSEFSSAITLPTGTHTLKLVATDSCSQTVHERTLVITYEPKVTPSVGNSVATTVDDKHISIEQAEPVSEHNVFERYVVPPLREIADFLDLTDPPHDGQAITSLPSAGRAALFVAGTSLVLSAVYVGSITTLPAHLAFITPHRRLILGGAMTAGAALLGVVFTF